jgi:hypothetical protein
MLERRRMSQRNPRYQTPGAGAAPSWWRGYPSVSTRVGSSQEKSPLNPVHHTTLATSSACRSSENGGSRSAGASWSSASTGGAVQALAADELVDHRPYPGGEGVPAGHVGGHAVVEGDPLAVHRDRAPD